MKIRSDQLDALLRQEQLTKPLVQPKESFDSFLSQEMGNAAETASEALPPPGARASGIDPLILSSLDGVAGTQAIQETELTQTIMTQMDGALSTFDSYAQTLSGQGAGKNAWELLGSLDGQVAALRGNLSKLSPVAAPGLEGMVNELEVLAVTEKFKFNRGDYI